MSYELGRARAVLSALGMAEPVLPAYDPAKVRPIPEAAAIRAFIAELERERSAKQRDVEAKQAPRKGWRWFGRK